MIKPINATVARLIRQANSAAEQGNLNEAQHVAREAVTQAIDTQHIPTQVVAHYTLAVMLWSDVQASPEEARQHAAEALRMADTHTDEYYLAMTLLARIDAGLGNLEQAQALNENLLDIYRRKERHSGIADMLRSLGDIALKRGDLTDAREHFEHGLALYEEKVDDPLNQAGLLLSLGSLAFREQQFDEARQHWEQAKALGEVCRHYQIITSAQQSLTLLEEFTPDE